MPRARGLEEQQQELVGELARMLRTRRGLSQRRVAAQIGVTEETIWHLESRTSPIAAETALTILQTLAANQVEDEQIRVIAEEVPPLHAELVFREIVSTHRNELAERGAVSWLAAVTGFSGQRVQQRLEKLGIRGSLK